MGFVSRKLGRLDSALGYYTEALRLDPAHLGATEYLGELYIQMGQIDRARTQLARLDQLCAYGCAQREELARWIERAE
jgi:tetratricopeptide (TPR) repeat protein